LRNIVAQCGPEPAGFKKVTLHVDDDQGDASRFEIERIGLRFDSSDASLPTSLHTPVVQ
jgi:hypothetical protein